MSIRRSVSIRGLGIAPRLCALLASALLAGCGSPLVDSGSPGQSPRALRPGEPAAIGNPAAAARAADLENVPRVPASSAVSLPPPRGETVYHEVLAGETPSSVARRYRVSVDQLLRINGLEQSATLKPGQLLAIP